MYAVHVIVFLLIDVTSGYFGWSSANNFNFIEEPSTWEAWYNSTTIAPSSPNLACFFCSQLLSVTKHRVGLSQNQLRAVLYDKCRVLPIVLKEQCFTFVEQSLPEIYFSLNYDFSTKDICVRLNLCDEDSPFASTGSPSEKSSSSSSTSSGATEDVVELTTTQNVINRKKSRQDRLLSHRNDLNGKNEEKRITCAFCERMLENAKNYAVTAKTDISSFATTACAKLPKGRYLDHCYQLADKKIAELAKFVDQQVIEALWCAELNQC